jgi:pimeloyl-ACP methyl ester carboxylesterase
MQFEQLTAGHGALTAVRAGNGPDLVILHSLLADRHAFDPVLPALTAKFRVTLINLPGFHGSQPAVLALMDAYVAAIEDGFEEFGIAKDAVLIGNGFGGTVAIAFAIAHPEAIEERKKVLLEIHPDGFQAACRILQETDLTPLLSHLRVPTLVLCGEMDQATPPALNKHVADHVADSHYVELAGCGHCPPLEQPQAFLAAIGEFIGL